MKKYIITIIEFCLLAALVVFVNHDSNAGSNYYSEEVNDVFQQPTFPDSYYLEQVEFSSVNGVQKIKQPLLKSGNSAFLLKQDGLIKIYIRCYSFGYPDLRYSLSKYIFPFHNFW